MSKEGFIFPFSVHNNWKVLKLLQWILICKFHIQIIYKKPSKALAISVLVAAITNLLISWFSLPLIVSSYNYLGEENTSIYLHGKCIWLHRFMLSSICNKSLFTVIHSFAFNYVPGLWFLQKKKLLLLRLMNDVHLHTVDYSILHANLKEDN